MSSNYKVEPNKLLLLELNEFVLYKVYDELINNNKNLKVIPLLVNAQDQGKLEIIFETLKLIQFIMLLLINMYH